MPPNLDSLRSPEGLPSKLSLDLDLFQGISCVLDSGGVIRLMSRSWDGFFARADRTELRSPSLVGAPFAELFPEESVRTAAALALEDLRAGIRECWSQTLELGSANKPLTISFTVRAWREERGRNVFVVHGLDVTQEHLTRAALLDRERKLQELRGALQDRESALEECRSTLDARTCELEELRKSLEGFQQEVAARRPDSNHRPIAHRHLAANLAEEFANLLTGVLGHSSLAAAELPDTHAAIEDIRAIERTAREAARVTRRLSALCGTARRGLATMNLCAVVEHLVQEHNHRLQCDWKQANLSADHSYLVQGDHSSLEIILEAMANLAWRYGGTEVKWTLNQSDGEVAASFNWVGELIVPAGWCDEDWSPQTKTHPDELLFAREAARALGGDLELLQEGEACSVRLSLPSRDSEGVLADPM